MKQIDFVLVVSVELETFYGILVAELRQERYKTLVVNAIGQCLDSLNALPCPRQSQSFRHPKFSLYSQYTSCLLGVYLLYL